MKCRILALQVSLAEYIQQELRCSAEGFAREAAVHPWVQVSRERPASAAQWVTGMSANGGGAAGVCVCCGAPHD